MDIIPSTAPKTLTVSFKKPNYLLIVDAYSKIPNIYRMEKVTTEQVMDNLDMFQSRFGKIDDIGCWNVDIISANAGLQFTLTEFKEEYQTRGVHLTLEAPEYQEMNRHVKVTLKNVLYNFTLSHGTC